MDGIQRHLCHRQNNDFLTNINAIWLVQSGLQKHFCLSLTQIISIDGSSRSMGGAVRDRHGRGAGCGGRYQCL